MIERVRRRSIGHSKERSMKGGVALLSRALMPSELITFSVSTVSSPQAPQPFLAPPRLETPAKSGAVTTLEAVISATGCNPAGDISEVGNVVSVNLVVREDTNSIFNPSTGST